MAIMIKQLMPECTSCVARVHSGLCSNCPHWTPSVVQELTEEMAERISATIGQENITRPNERNNCNMEINEQENTQEVQQENLIDGSQSVQAMQKGNELPTAVQLVQPQAALDEIAELEKKYRETIERENK